MKLNDLKLPVVDKYRVRYWGVDDARCVINAAQDALIPQITTIPESCDEIGAVDWINRQNDKIDRGTDLPLCIADHSSNRALGMIGLFGFAEDERVRGGYWLMPCARGNGAISTILERFSSWAINTLGISGIDLYIDPENKSSIKSAEKSGYHLIELVADYVINDTKAKHMARYEFSKSVEAP